MKTGTSRKDRAPGGAVIGVDGGGTRCRLALCVGETRHEATVGACNLSSDFELSIRELRVGLGALSRQSGHDLASIPAHLALAGVVSDEIAARVRAALPLAVTEVAEDRGAALRGALGRRDGAVLHAGTGSFVGVQRGGHTRFAGGWGARLGDEGSGYWVGRAALRLRLSAAEGRAAEGALVRAIDARIGDAPAVIAFVAGAATQEIAALAPLVSEAAERDADAADILVTGAGYLSDLASKIGFGDEGVLCLTGGFGPQYLRCLPPDLQRRVQPPEGSPLDGALALARDFAETQ